MEKKIKKNGTTYLHREQKKKKDYFAKKKQKKTQKHKNTKKIKIILLKIYLKKFK